MYGSKPDKQLERSANSSRCWLIPAVRPYLFSPIVFFSFPDLSVGLLNVLTDIIWRITVTWEAGNLACKFIKFMQCLTTYASTYVLVALSIDRYDAITHPMNFSGSWKRAKILVISAWVMSALFSTPQFFLYEETLIQGELDFNFLLFRSNEVLKLHNFNLQILVPRASYTKRSRSVLD